MKNTMPNNIDDVFKFHNTTQTEFEEKWKGHSPHTIGHELEILIVATYNNGVLPDWSDGTYKYWANFKMSSSSGSVFSYCDYADWRTVSAVGARQVFIGENAYENMMDAVEKFLPQYEQSRTA